VGPTTAAMTATAAGDGGGAPFYGPNNVVSMASQTIDCESFAVIQNSRAQKNGNRPISRPYPTGLASGRDMNGDALYTLIRGVQENRFV